MSAVVDVTSGGRRSERVTATREALMSAAERLFAERGVHAVSIRQISEAAGQGNNAAVNYHFGTKTALVRAIVSRHAAQIDAIRARIVLQIKDSDELRDWVACVVRSVTEHLDNLGRPSWYARFIAQVTADPALHEITAEEFFATSSSMQVVRDGVNRCLPVLAPNVYTERAAMMGHLITQVTVDQERALADGRPTPRSGWDDTATGLIDAIVAIWQAPVSTE